MATILELPYFAPASELPQALPTNDEIHASTNEYTIYGPRRLVRIGPYMIKYGSDISVIEGENMLSVRQETTIPIPRVYAIYTVTGMCRATNKMTDYNYIVMEYLEGQSLEKEWTSLSTQQRDSIAAQLREYIKQLRSLPSPGYYGSIGHRGLLDCIFWTGNDAAAPLDGPFTTDEGLHEAMLRKFNSNNLSPFKAEFHRRAFRTVLRSQKSAFTHGDFQRKNIMIKRIPPLKSVDTSAGVQQLNPQDDTFEIAIIDWENAGWYPDYWESAIALYSCAAWCDDWHAWVAKSMELFITEYTWMQMLRDELWS